MVLISLNFWKKLVMCTEEACQVAVHMYQYTAGSVPVVYWWCTGGVLVVYWWCTGGVLVVYWWCTGAVHNKYHVAKTKKSV